MLNIAFSTWQKKPLVAITKDMVTKQHQLIGKNHGEAYANLAMRTLCALFNFAAGQYEDSQEKTLITKEYPHEFSKDNEPFYPINDVKNQELLLKYQNLAQQFPAINFGGRLAEYKYYDMHQVIENALIKSKI